MTSITMLWIANILQVLSLMVFGYGLRKMQRELDKTPTRAETLAIAEERANAAYRAGQVVLAHNLRTLILKPNGMIQGHDAIYNMIAKMLEEVDPLDYHPVVNQLEPVLGRTIAVCDDGRVAYLAEDGSLQITGEKK